MATTDSADCQQSGIRIAQRHALRHRTKQMALQVKRVLGGRTQLVAALDADDGIDLANVACRVGHFDHRPYVRSLGRRPSETAKMAQLLDPTIPHWIHRT